MLQFRLIYKILVIVIIITSGISYNSLGNSLKNNRIEELYLDNSVKLEFEKIVQEIKIDPYDEPREFANAIGNELEKILPKKVVRTIQSIKHENGPDLVIIHNFPIDSHLPETPRDAKRSSLKGFTSEAAILSVSNILSTIPFYNANEKDGTVINQIIPLQSAKYEKQMSSFGSRLELLPHTENIYQIPPLKYFSLLCLRSDPKVSTSVIFLDDILAALEAKNSQKYTEYLKLMRQPLFQMSSGPSHENKKTSSVLPIVETTKSGNIIFRLNLNSERTLGITDEAKEVVTALSDVITSVSFKNKHVKRIYLKSGDFILFKNWKVMHARDKFKIDTANWRWLQRCYFNDKKNS